MYSSKISNLTQLLLDNKHTEDSVSYELKKTLRLELERLKRKPVFLEITLQSSKTNVKIQSIGDLQMSFNLQDSQEVVLTATVLDAEGKPATLVATTTWSVSDPSVGNLTANGLSATYVPVTTGNVIVTFAVDGVTATFSISVTGGPAATATITAGTPTPQPVAQPVPAA